MSSKRPPKKYFRLTAKQEAFVGAVSQLSGISVSEMAARGCIAQAIKIRDELVAGAAKQATPTTLDAEATDGRSEGGDDVPAAALPAGGAAEIPSPA